MEAFYMEIVEYYRNIYQNNECALAGNNGPYHQKETFVRNTAHWLVSFSCMYRMTKDETYAGPIQAFAERLLQEVSESKNGALCCIPQNRLSTNGLIGLAWAIEGLVEGYKAMPEEKYLTAAERIVFSQQYDKHLHTWSIVDPQGHALGIDIAFNHSLWFCMAVAKLESVKKNDQLSWMVTDYLDHVTEQFMIYRNGLISHFTMKNGDILLDIKRRVHKQICAITRHGVPGRKWDTMEYERAYHLFNLYALAWLFRLHPETAFFRSEKFIKIRNFGCDINNFLSFPTMNQYAFGYNSPAYEMPLVAYIFGTGKDQEYSEKLLALHKQYNWNDTQKKYTDNVPDDKTLDARVYEIVQYYCLKEQGK